MIGGDSILVSLVRLVDSVPFPPPSPQRKRGRQPTYSDQLILKAVVVMIIRRPNPKSSELKYVADTTDPLARGGVSPAGNPLSTFQASNVLLFPGGGSIAS